MKPSKVVFTVLLAGCLLLATAMVSLWMGLGPGIRPAPALVAATPEAGGDAAAGEFELPSFDTYAEVIQRPLFNEDRRPQVEIPVETPDDGQGPGEDTKVELNVAVTGIIITPDTRLAMVTNNVSKETLRLKVGESLDGEQAGWTLASIEPRRLEFDGGSQGKAEVELVTYTQALKGGAPPPRRTAVVTQKNENADSTQADAGTQQAPDSDADRAARAEEIRRRVAERRAQLREEAERRRAEANLDDEDDE